MERNRRSRDVILVGIRCSHRSFGQIVSDRVSVSRPRGRIRTMPDRALRNLYRHARSHDTRSRPAGKRIACTRRVVERNCGSCIGICRRICGCNRSAAQVIVQVIRIQGPLCRIGQVAGYSVGRRSDGKRCLMIRQPVSCPSVKSISCTRRSHTDTT